MNYKIPKKDDTPYFAKSPYVKELTPRDFDSVATWKLKSKGCSIVLFYAPYCSYCAAVKDIYEQLGRTALFLDVLAMNCEKHSSHISKIKEDMPELVRGYPTIIFYKNGAPVEQFADERTHENLLKACMRLCQGTTQQSGSRAKKSSKRNGTKQ